MKIVITGATSGIGAALARHYAQPGVILGLLGRRQDRLAEVIRRCEEQGAIVIGESLDVRDGAAMRIFAEQFVSRADGVDLVIANAGVGHPDDLASGDIAPHAQQFEINVIGVLNTLIPFVPQMIQQQHGHLVAIASVAGFRALPGSTTYAASKIAVRTLMEGYGWALQPHGITVTSINPGFVISEMTDKNKFHMPFLLSTDAAVQKMARAIQRKRRIYTFPWQMALLARLLPYLPSALLRRAIPA
jgi:short-subunit dehydrogenase